MSANTHNGARVNHPPNIMASHGIGVRSVAANRAIGRPDLCRCAVNLLCGCTSTVRKMKAVIPAKAPAIPKQIAYPPPPPPLPLHNTQVAVIKSKQKKWPDNQSTLLPYKDLIGPIKDVLAKGYRLFRKDVKEFTYEGYTIGDRELLQHPSPKAWLTEKGLEEDKKRGLTLADTLLNITFLLGVEQGRRAERRDQAPIENLLEALNAYRETNKNLRFRNDELELLFNAREMNPSMSVDELQSFIRSGLEERKAKRIQELREELKLDPTKSSFQIKTIKKAKFSDLEELAKSLTKETCTIEQWEDILVERGWTLKLWRAKCKNKKLATIFA